MRNPATFALAGALLCLGGCGYVGDPKPPALNIPRPILDLSAVQRGKRILVTFTVAALTTEGLAIRTPGKVEIQAGPDWPGGAAKFPAAMDDAGRAQADLAAGEFIGKEITVAARMASPKGRFSEWSNLVRLEVVPPLDPPAGLRAAATPGGVELSWTPSPGGAPDLGYRVYRRGKEGDPQVIARVASPPYVDASAAFGSSYTYFLQAARKAGPVEPESELSEAVSITPRDIFPPAVPSGLNAITGIHSIELAWNRVTDADLKGYRVYRSVDGGAFERVAEVETPSYSDGAVESGKRYQYVVSAFDQEGNESARSAAVQASAP